MILMMEIFSQSTITMNNMDNILVYCFRIFFFRIFFLSIYISFFWIFSQGKKQSAWNEKILRSALASYLHNVEKKPNYKLIRFSHHRIFRCAFSCVNSLWKNDNASRIISLYCLHCFILFSKDHSRRIISNGSIQKLLNQIVGCY